MLVLYKNEPIIEVVGLKKLRDFLGMVGTKSREINETIHELYNQAKEEVNDFSDMKLWDFVYNKNSKTELICEKIEDILIKKLFGTNIMSEVTKCCWYQKDDIKYYCFINEIKGGIERLKNNNLTERYQVNGNEYKYIVGKWIKCSNYFENVGSDLISSLYQCRKLVRAIDSLYYIMVINQFDVELDIKYYIKLIIIDAKNFLGIQFY